MDKQTILFLILGAFCIGAWLYYSLVWRLKNKPGKVSFQVSQGEKNMLKFCVCLPPKSADDVTSRELCVSINDGDTVKKTVDGDTVHVDEFVGQHGDTVAGYLVDIDGAGNRSEPSLFNFTLVDNIAPPMPGEVGVMVLGQVEPEAPTPVDPVETPEDPA